MKIVLYGTYPSLREDRLRTLLGAEYELIPVSDDADFDAKAAALSDAQVIVGNKFDENDPPAPQLRLLQSPSAGLENIKLDSVPAQALVAAGQGHEIPMAEYVLCSMLDHAVGFRELASTFEKGEWHRGHWIKGPVHAELYGKTLGLLGYGAVARETAKRARSFGMRIAALSRWTSGRPSGDLVDACFAPDERKTFLSGIDYLLVTIPLSEQTRSYVDAEWFAEMGSQTVLINVARGPVVDEEALYQALRHKRIGGAVIDVWYKYPPEGGARVSPSQFPFHELENVIMTPHGSGRTTGTFDRRWEKIAENVKRLGDGRPLEGLVAR